MTLFAFAVYVAGSLFMLRVIYLDIVCSEYLTPSGKAWRAPAAFVCWPLSFAYALARLLLAFFWKGQMP